MVLCLNYSYFLSSECCIKFVGDIGRSCLLREDDDTHHVEVEKANANNYQYEENKKNEDQGKHFDEFIDRVPVC